MQVFDDKSTFTEWFGDSLGKNAQGEGSEDEWLATEKRVVVIHRLHQILEPFMLRRQVEDVESKLPPKVPAWPQHAMRFHHPPISSSLIIPHYICALLTHLSVVPSSAHSTFCHLSQ